MNIQFFSRSMNYPLYVRSRGSIRLPWPCNRYLYTTADGYFYRMLRSDADIAINIDEDAFVYDNKRLRELLEFFLDHHYVNCGMPDGGVVATKQDNPLVTNAFFNILDLRIIRRNFSMKLLADYRVWKPEWETLIPAHMMRTPYRFWMYEPYYPFFCYLAVNFKTLYLDARPHPDGISTCLLDHRGEVFLLHSWFSREYGVSPEHTARINALFAECGGELRIPEWRLQGTRLLERIGFKCLYRPYFKGRLMAGAVRRRLDRFAKKACR